MHHTNRAPNTFDLLPEPQKRYLFQQRQELNDTFGPGLDILKKRFFMRYIPDEGFRLWDDVRKTKVGVINYDTIA